ncbi:hypothetical protein [Dyadobacter sp. OTU695]|uniref:hypothetical protein n=1 Tax=Dyadobacter sp. OTU695 TaxID=3043860 RepID=UPI00313C051D
MTKYEEIFFIANLLVEAKADGSVDLNEAAVWKSLYLTDKTVVHEDYLFQLNDKGLLYYDEFGEDGFKPIVMCSTVPQTRDYLKHLILEIEYNGTCDRNEIERLDKRITDILTFNPKKLSDELKATESVIAATKEQLRSSSLLQPMIPQLNQIEEHFKSLNKVARNYEEVYKNIILPVKEEGKLGVRQTVRWAILSIIISTLFSIIITWVTK